jgi:hypothetical protein
VPKRKYEIPLKLDMDFGEALSRLAQTDQKELNELVKSAEGKIRLIEDADTGDRLLIYMTPQGLRIEAIYDGSEIRMTQAQMSRLFGRDQSVIARHLKRIEQMDGLPPETLYAESAYKGVNDQTFHRRLYTVDAINYVGFRVNSPQGILFRRWASGALGQIIAKGFYIDKDRLKAPEQQSILDELRDTIREIRASTQNVYREVKRICTMCQDYDGSIPAAWDFFAAMENKLLWAATSMTGAQIIMQRADISKPDMGLTYHTGKRGVPTQGDVETANNYLAEPEARLKNRSTTMLLDYFEEQVDQGRLVTMAEAEGKLDDFIRFNHWPLLTHKGDIKGEDARARARALLKRYKAQVH